MKREDLAKLSKIDFEKLVPEEIQESQNAFSRLFASLPVYRPNISPAAALKF
jgi:hypothetical protein